MAQFNAKTKTPSKKTFEGGSAYKRTPKQELFVAAISDFVDTDTFYESRVDKNARLVSLTQKVTKSDPEWMEKFIHWLRNDANMRSVSLLIAVEAAVVASSVGYSGRKLLAGALSRADEPGEALGYWNSTRPGKSLPAAVKRGVADAAVKLYNEFSILKYDSHSNEYRFGDVINLTHPKPTSPKQEQEFKLALDRRYNNVALTGSSLLSMQRNREEFNALTDEQKIELLKSDTSSTVLKIAGLTWENVLSSVKADKKVLWEALIPTMGYMALLRNLRNFEDADISRATWNKVYKRIADRENVLKSRQLPFRFLSAYGNISEYHNKLKDALEVAVSHSLENLDRLEGNSLVFFDLSGSMFWSGLSSRSSMTFAQSATLFAHAMAKKSDAATLVGFGSNSTEFPIPRSFEGILAKSNQIGDMGGTDFSGALTAHYRDGVFDRIIVVTDEQYHGGYGRNPYSKVKNIPVYVWNMNGYEPSSVSGQKNVHQLGGLSSESFKTITLLEMGEKGVFPWETQ